jgi:hypothetical protein
MIAPAFEEDAWAAERKDRPKITVTLNNYAQAPGWTLEEAKSVAGRILLLAGVQCFWREPYNLDSDPAALRRGDEVRLALNIISQEMSVALARSELSLGLAILPGASRRGDIGYVFYHRVEELAQGEGVSPGLILGHALAHEIGHLLLNSSEHPRVGVMQAEWLGPQMQLLREGRLLFTSEQSRRMRAELRKRDALRPADVTTVENASGGDIVRTR